LSAVLTGTKFAGVPCPISSPYSHSTRYTAPPQTR